MTQVFTDQTLTTSFQGMSLNRHLHELSWTKEPSVSQCVQNDTD